MLLDAGADPYALNDVRLFSRLCSTLTALQAGLTPLEVAREEEQTDLVRLLLNITPEKVHRFQFHIK